MRVSRSGAARILMDVLFPGRCMLCGEWLQPDAGSGVPLCPGCRVAVPLLDGARCERCGTRLISEHGTCTRCRDADFIFESNAALFSYTGDARILLNAFKFSGRQRLAAWFAWQASVALRSMDVPVVPVPARPGRRTPDPVDQVCRCLERGHRLSVMRLLERTGGAQQKTLDFKRRRENLLGRIRLARGVEPSDVPPRVVLLDDVFTTGATLDACARVLRAAGCTGVDGLTLVIEE